MSKINYKATFIAVLLIALLATGVSLISAQGPGSELERAMAGEFDGAEVSMMSVWTSSATFNPAEPIGPENLPEDGDKFQLVLDAFNEATGITVTNDGTRDFEALIPVRAEGGDPPDVAVFPQPGLMARVSEYLVPLDDVLDPATLEENYIQSWIDYGTVDGKMFGVYYRAANKSLVWYRVAEFADRGYEVPETWDEMTALMDQMVADGVAPWCVGIEQGSATGWVATDWVEVIVLRTAGLDVYNGWISHEIPFSDERIKNAVQIMGDIWLNPDYVYGGTTFILTTNTGDAPAPMFDDPPGCMMHRQAGWIPAFFPADQTVPDDVTFFYLPPIDESIGKPVLGAGDAVSMFNDRPEVRAFVQWLATPEGAQAWIEAEGFISPIRTTPLDWYGNPSDLLQADIMNNADIFGFDASDLMPAEVGTGTFWTGMVDYINGDNLDDVLQQIDDSWPTD
jgi:alpha-glucoside transport system substrate-binding protein